VVVFRRRDVLGRSGGVVPPSSGGLSRRVDRVERKINSYTRGDGRTSSPSVRLLITLLRAGGRTDGRAAVAAAIRFRQLRRVDREPQSSPDGTAAAAAADTVDKQFRLQWWRISAAPDGRLPNPRWSRRTVPIFSVFGTDVSSLSSGVYFAGGDRCVPREFARELARAWRSHSNDSTADKTIGNDH